MHLTDLHKIQLEQLYTLFSEWNSKINLSAIREKEDVYQKHFADSLLIGDTIDFTNKKVLDIGTGGGFPLLPLSITNPSAHFTGLDSVGKKLKAVQAMADELKLNTTTIHGRIEDYGQKKAHRERYDIVTARALAPWPVLLEYALPFVKVGGAFVAYQGPAIEEDLRNFPGLEEKLGGELEDVVEKNLEDAVRYFVLIKKIKPTPKKYPRENGVPRLTPLQ